MVLRSTLPKLQMLVSEVASVDVEMLSGADAAHVVDMLTGVVRQLTAFSSACAARAVAGNQHTLSGSPNGAAWVAEKTGISEKQARRQLGLQKRLSSLPEVEQAVRSGSVSEEVAAVIVSSVDGDTSMAHTLLATAAKTSVEGVQRRARELVNTRVEDAADKRRRLRCSQYFHVRQDGDMVFGSFGLLADVAAPLLLQQKDFERKALNINDQRAEPLPVAATCAEAFAAQFSDGAGKAKTIKTLNFHIDLEAWRRGWPTDGERCELGGIGPVPTSVIQDAFDDGVLRVIVTEKNKLLGYYEQDRRRKRGIVPDSVKRAVKAAAYDTCETHNCFHRAMEVDHIQATSKGGHDGLDNLQALCEACHDAKTKSDAPWTIGTIFGKKRREREAKKREACSLSTAMSTTSAATVASAELFPDTS